jgi:hypothetical protein
VQHNFLNLFAEDEDAALGGIRALRGARSSWLSR